MILPLLLSLLQEGHSVHGEAFNEGPRQAAVRMAGMGDVRFGATSTSEEAKAFVDQGVAQLHGFYYFEAERSFRQAAKLDPDCAVAYWGMAAANVNNEKRAKGFIDEAVKRKDKASPRERLWIETWRKYYTEKDKAAKAKALVKGLEELVVEFPDDLEAKAFLAWACWHVKDKGLPIQSHVAVDGLLRDVLAERPSHPGAHHYTIHLWDAEKAPRALKAAEGYGPSSPGIAHAWHMPGHIYAKLDRHADAAWHQEASSRVDHAQMRRDGTMPWQIHNYAHNQQWCVKSLGLVGRVGEGLALAANLIEIPKHPQLNHDGSSGHCFREGRARMIDLLSAWEMWDGLLARKDGVLAAIENRDDTIHRSRAIGAAYAETGRLDDARAVVASLEALKSGPAEEEKKEEEEQEEKKDEKKKDDGKNKRLDSALNELRGRIALAEGDAKKAVELLAKAGLPKATLALLYLKAGDREKAEKASTEAVASGKGELLPMAVRAEVMQAVGQKPPPELAKLGRFADPDLPILKRIGFAPPAPRPTPEAGGRGTSLDDLGPLVWSPVAAPETPFAVDGPTLVIFYLGSGCSHCREQLAAFAKVAPKLEAAGLKVIAVSTETAEQVEKAREEKRVVVPFEMRADPEHGLFKAFRCWDDFEAMPLHGTFLLDGARRIRWQDISYKPFMDAAFLLKEITRLKP